MTRGHTAAVKLAQKKQTRRTNQSGDTQAHRDAQFDDCESDVLRSHLDTLLYSRSPFTNSGKVSEQALHGAFGRVF